MRHRREGRNSDPSGAVIDSQAVKGSGVGGPERGYDGAKRPLWHSKRHMLVDTKGLWSSALPSTPPEPARSRRRARASERRTRKKELPRLEFIWADGRTRASFAGGPKKSEVGASRYRTIQRLAAMALRTGGEASRIPGAAEVVVVERTYAWLGQARRLAKDYERLPETAVAMIYWAMSQIMLRRLALTPY
jgi:putative transposase